MKSADGRLNILSSSALVLVLVLFSASSILLISRSLDVSRFSIS